MADHNSVELLRGQEREIDLRDVLALALDGWRWIVGITLVVLLIAALYALSTARIYQTNALVQVESRETGIGGLAELSTLLGEEAPTEAEIEIIRSRSVLLEAIEQRHLDIVVRPVRFPLLGGFLARQHASDEPAGAWPGFERFAWGGEDLQIDRLDIDRALEGETLVLTAGEGGEYTLHDPDGELLLQGRVGEAAQGNGVEMFVARIDARAGTRFEVTHLDEFVTLANLHERLRVAERGRKTGILELTLEGEDREEIAETLNAIVNIYVRQNVERRSAEAAQTLDFITGQLPELKAELDSAEEAMNRFRVEKGSVDMSLETQGLLEQLAELERQASELSLRRAELAQRFTSQHPAMIAIARQEAETGDARAQLERQIRELPEAEQHALQLMRDVRVTNELYTLLLNRAQELKVVRAGTVGNVRVIDTAFVPRQPVRPKLAVIFVAAILLGTMLGLFVVFLRQMLDGSMHDPKDLEQAFDLPVYAIVPRSDIERQLGERHLIAVHAPDDPAVESLRSLRTSLEFLLKESGSRIITIGGPAPAVGKSFVSANLAVLFAQVGRKVLVIDADLRKGHVHRKFMMDRAPGLSELITGHANPEDAIRRAGPENLFVLPSGRFPPNPAELLASRRVEKLLTAFADEYDLVLVDAPPVLAASEAAHLARLAGTNLLVVRSGRQTRREVELAVDRLERAGASTAGFIFNDMAVGSRRYAYAGYRYYRYDNVPEREER